MKNTLKKYRLHVQELETKAAEKVDDHFDQMTVDPKVMKKNSIELIRAIVPEVKQSIKEGYAFGTYIQGLSKRRQDS